MNNWNSSTDSSPIFRWQIGKVELFPPFLQKEHPRLSDHKEEEETHEEEIVDPVTVCGSAEAVEDGRPLRNCKDDCRKRGLICEESYEGLDGEKISVSDMGSDKLLHAFNIRGQNDYARYEDDFIDEEEEDEQIYKSRFPWLATCESAEGLSGTEETPGTTDPYISHELYLPYNKTLKSRQYTTTLHDDGTKYTLGPLPRRSRSPVREILPDKFNLNAAFEKWANERNLCEMKKLLDESKERISLSLVQACDEQADRDAFIAFMVLQAICEEVTLTLADVKIDANIHTFVNIAVIWALTEMNLLNYDMLYAEQLRSPGDLVYCRYNGKNILNITGDGGMRKLLLGIHQPPISHNIYTTLHPRLPWAYVNPSHEQAHTKFHPNVRDRIDEHYSDLPLICAMSAYIPDVECVHRRHILEKSFVASNMRSKYLSASSSHKMRQGRSLQLVKYL